MLTRRHPSDIQDSRLIAVLGKFLPPIIARSIVERARREAVSGPEVSWTDPNGLLDRISVGVRLFAAPDQQAAILRDITDLAVSDFENAPPSRPFSEELPPASQIKPPSRPPPSMRPRAEEPVTTRREAAASPPSAPAPPPSSVPAISGAIPRRDYAQPPRSPSDYATTNRGVFSTSGQRSAALPQARTYGVRPPAPSPYTAVAPPAAPSEAWGRSDRSGSAPFPPPPANPSGMITARGSDVTPPTGMPKVGPPPSSRRADSSRDSREITIVLTTEHDIPRARQVAREICEALGTRALTQQRLVTIVSELGRNMVLYAGGGQITLRPPLSSNRRVLVLAVDHGPGIPNLPEILAGKYKSRSGLGLGIVGTKRLADSFHIETGRHGTEIRVEVIV